MEELLELQEIFGIGAQPLSLVSTIFNFIACVIMSFVVRFFYIKYSYSLTGKIHIASIMPILAQNKKNVCKFSIFNQTTYFIHLLFQIVGSNNN